MYNVYLSNVLCTHVYLPVIHNSYHHKTVIIIGTSMRFTFTLNFNVLGGFYMLRKLLE